MGHAWSKHESLNEGPTTVINPGFKKISGIYLKPHMNNQQAMLCSSGCEAAAERLIHKQEWQELDGWMDEIMEGWMDGWMEYS